MSISSSATNEWPQVDEVELMASNGLIMEKPISSSAQDQQQQQQQQQQALKCPRCDSSNTKFCYYNNYSLSQPRHFCKACKRYWTRGGTLRNVPVGGGCRKNKRVKRSVNASSSSSSPDPSSSSSSSLPINGSSTSLSNTPLTTTTSTTASSMAITSMGNHHSSSTTAPLFYGTSEVNHLTVPRFHNMIKSTAAFDLQPQFSDLGLGFGSSSLPMTTQVEDVIASNSLLSGFNSSTALLASSTPFIGSNLQNSVMGDLKHSRPANRFQALFPFRDLQMGGHHSDDHQAILMKELKVEHGTKEEFISGGPCQNPVELFNSFDSSLYWNPTNSSTVFGANWPDLSNYGSSVTPLI